MEHLINWVEIPVADMNRAVAFYGRILGIEFHRMAIGAIEYALFPAQDRFNCGALVRGANYRPGKEGPLIYLDGGRDLNQILKKVGPAGGTVRVEKMLLSDEAGYIGMFLDSEGNNIGLQHAKPAA
jgi:uncharacterized protein